MQLTKTTIPRTSLIAESLPTLDFQECFETEINHKNIITARDLFKTFFYSAPAWLENLLSLRNALVKGFGLKAPEVKDKEVLEVPIKVGAVVGLFKILGISENEVLAGEDDKHLNFRISIILDSIPSSTGNRYSFKFSTVVQYTHWTGKVYFFIIKPFHKIIVPVMMRRIIANINRE